MRSEVGCYDGYSSRMLGVNVSFIARVSICQDLHYLGRLSVP